MVTDRSMVKKEGAAAVYFEEEEEEDGSKWGSTRVNK